MSEVTLYVGGMGCRRCVREVTARLRDVPGVGLVAADINRERVRIVGSMTVEPLLAALVDTAYRVRVLEAAADGCMRDPDRQGTADGQDGP